MHNAHVHCSCIMHMFIVHAQYTCSLFMHNAHVHCSCIMHMFIVHAQWTCSLFMHNANIHCSCTMNMFIFNAQNTCSLFTHDAHVHNLCTMRMFINAHFLIHKTIKNLYTCVQPLFKYADVHLFTFPGCYCSPLTPWNKS